MAQKEQLLASNILLEAAKTRTALFRNTVGMGWAGKMISNQQGRVQLVNAYPLQAGLTKGSPDLVGWHTVEITPEMVGKKVAVFTGVEVKTKGVRETPRQQNFIKRLNEAGGIALFARSVEEVVEAIKGFKGV